MLKACAAPLAALALLFAAPPAAPAEAALPPHDLIVELRSADGAASGNAWDLRSSDAARDRIARSLRVRNGASASLRLSTLQPVQTWQWLPGLWRGGSAAPATQWIEVSQALEVQPRWPGGAQPVALSLRAHDASLAPNVAPGSAEPPSRRAAALETVVDAPLGEWVVLATSGDARDAPGRALSTRDAGAAARTLQLRVRLAP